METYKFERKEYATIPLKNDDVYGIISKKNGQRYRQEFYYGSNYLRKHQEL